LAQLELQQQHQQRPLVLIQQFLQVEVYMARQLLQVMAVVLYSALNNHHHLALRVLYLEVLEELPMHLPSQQRPHLVHLINLLNSNNLPLDFLEQAAVFLVVLQLSLNNQLLDFRHSESLQSQQRLQPQVSLVDSDLSRQVGACLAQAQLVPVGDFLESLRRRQLQRADLELEVQLHQQRQLLELPPVAVFLANNNRLQQYNHHFHLEPQRQHRNKRPQ
jgi:hypothetical protein